MILASLCIHNHLQLLLLVLLFTSKIITTAAFSNALTLSDRGTTKSITPLIPKVQVTLTTSQLVPSTESQRPTTTILMMSSSIRKNLYNITGSGWKSPTWNWGSAVGTGHDCAAICRRRWGYRENRLRLMQSLLRPANEVEVRVTLGEKGGNKEEEISFEEIKLILGLAWQRGRWDGTDGGPGGYSEVLFMMADAERYEMEDEMQSAKNLIEDVAMRFSTIAQSQNDMDNMQAVLKMSSSENKKDILRARRICVGLVMDAMNFPDNGL